MQALHGISHYSNYVCLAHFCRRSQVVGADVMGEANVSSDPAMDQWSVGVVAFELMTNRRFYPTGESSCGCAPCGAVANQPVR